MKIKITQSIKELIAHKRISKKLTQKTLAAKIGISQQTYRRIESGINKTCEVDILKKIFDELEITELHILNETSVLKSYRMPVEIIHQIQNLQKQKKFRSETEALLYILNEYFTNINFKNVRYEMEELLEDIVVKTFIKEMKKMGREIEKYKDILAMIEAKEHINSLQYLSEYEETLYKKIHAERMK